MANKIRYVTSDGRIEYAEVLLEPERKNAQDLANKIYDQLSQEQQKKASKEDLAYELYGFENEQEALKYLKQSGYKFKNKIN